MDDLYPTTQGLQAIVKDGQVLKFGVQLDAEADKINAEIFAVQDQEESASLTNSAYTHVVYDTDESIILFADTKGRCDDWCKNHNGKVEGAGGDPCYETMPVKLTPAKQA